MENEARSVKSYQRGDQYCIGGLPNGKPCTSRSGTVEAMPTLHNPPQEETSYSSREKRQLVKEAMHATITYNDDKASSTNEASPILTTEPDHEESIFDAKQTSSNNEAEAPEAKEGQFAAGIDSGDESDANECKSSTGMEFVRCHRGMEFLRNKEYVDTIRKLMFTIPKAECNEIMKQYERIAPLPLTSQFKDQLPKLEAVQKYLERNQSTTSMYPTEQASEEEQDELAIESLGLDPESERVIKQLLLKRLPRESTFQDFSCSRKKARRNVKNDKKNDDGPTSSLSTSQKRSTSRRNTGNPGSELSKFNARDRLIAEKRINDVIFDIEIKNQQQDLRNDFQPNESYSQNIPGYMQTNMASQRDRTSFMSFLQ
eukprot:gene5763-11042_t